MLISTFNWFFFSPYDIIQNKQLFGHVVDLSEDAFWTQEDPEKISIYSLDFSPF